MSMRFEEFIGVDYSGRGEPDQGLEAIQVYRASPRTPPVIVRGPAEGRWSRAALARWLIERMHETKPMLVGLDHAFSFPLSDFGPAKTWDEFLRRFAQRWRTDERPVRREEIRRAFPGCHRRLRLAEQWTSSAKSVFLCDGPGVACATFAGLPWLWHIRQACQDRVFFWPFDGWHPPSGVHVIAEVYPSIFRNRYRERVRLTGDRLDAYAVAAWMRDMQNRGQLQRYFDPPLSDEERSIALREGWILGIL